MIFKTITLFAFLIRSAYTDLKENRIENRLILSGYVTAMIFAYIQSGISGMLKSTAAAGMVILCLFPLFMIKGLGAGDIKLFSLIAAFFREKIIGIIAFSFLVGGFIILVMMMIRWFKKVPVYKKNEIIHFSIPIAIGTWIQIIGDVLKEVV